MDKLENVNILKIIRTPGIDQKQLSAKQHYKPTGICSKTCNW